MEERIEILAPAGGEEQLVAAVRAGADAVYLGTQRFNARQSAHNFDEDRLAAAVTYCHARGVAVHVTLNTLVRDEELPDALEELSVIARSGADAVIVQDLGVAAMVREHCPSLALHASTQLAVHNLSGVRELEKLGFSRVVLARELSLKEIGRICANTPLEVEVFVHGALCMSVSGCCTLSAMLGGRSGNRGRCAQPCRLDFRAGERGYALSLKDMCHLDAIGALRKAGVCSLKIEGRMKRPDYVAAAVQACRLAREGKEYDREGLRAVFSRSGFTDGYLTGRRDLSMFGVRTKEDVDASRGSKGLGEITRTEFPRVPVDMTIEVQTACPVRLTVEDGTHTVTVTGPVPQKALSRETGEKEIRESLQKTGGTPFVLEHLTARVAPGLAVRGGDLNALRREGLSQLLVLRGAVSPHPFQQGALPAPERHTPPASPALRVRAERVGGLPEDLDGVQRVILPLEEILAQPDSVQRFKDRLVAEIPALVFPSEEDGTMEALTKAAALGVREALCENIGAVRMALDAGMAPLGGAGLNVLNSRSLAVYEALGVKDVTVSFELDFGRIRALGGTVTRGIVAYGYLPLMRLRACPVQGPSGCGGCDGRSSLRDRTGVTFRVLCSGRRFSTLLNSVPLVLPHKDLSGVDFLTLWFTTEPRQQAQQVLQAYRKGLPLPGPRTGGLYYRTIE